MNNPMPAAPTAWPRDTPLVPLSRGCAVEKGGGETNREERKREGAMGGERQTRRKEKGKGIPSLVTTLKRPHPSRALSSPHPSSSRGLPWGAEPAKPRSSPSETLLTAGCRPHTSPGSRTSLSSQPLCWPSGTKEGAIWAPLRVLCMAALSGLESGEHFCLAEDPRSELKSVALDYLKEIR